MIAFFGDMAMLLYIVFWMFLLDWRLALISLLIMPPLIAVTIWFRLHRAPPFAQCAYYVARISTFLQERITGMPVIQLFNREQTELHAS